MIVDHVIGQWTQQAVAALTALDAGFFAETRTPFVSAKQYIPRFTVVYFPSEGDRHRHAHETDGETEPAFSEVESVIDSSLRGSSGRFLRPPLDSVLISSAIRRAFSASRAASVFFWLIWELTQHPSGQFRSSTLFSSGNFRLNYWLVGFQSLHHPSGSRRDTP